MLDMEFPQIVINDNTLLDGEHTPGVSFRDTDKVAIAQALEAAGVDELTAGLGSRGRDGVEALRTVRGALRRAEIIARGRMTEADVERALAAGVNRVSLFVPLSDRQIRASSLKGGRRSILGRIRRVVGYAREQGLKVNVEGEDASLADLDFVCQAVIAAEEAGALRFRFDDTFGAMDPFRVYAVFRRLCAETDLELEFHGHDDMGLATANTIAAVRGGATHVAVAVLGLGARAGTAPLEEVTTALTEIEGVRAAVNPVRFASLADLVAQASGRAIPEGKAIVGSNAFTHESGIHVAGLLKDHLTYEPIAPERFGRTRRIVIGKHSGRAAVGHALRLLGVSADDRSLNIVLDRVREHASRTKSVVENDALLEFYRAANQAEDEPPVSQSVLTVRER